MTTPVPIPDYLPAWHVLGDQIATNTTLLPGAAGLAQVHDIPYMIDSGPAKGLIRHVQVSPSEFTPDSVQAAIVEDLSATHLIASLGQPGA